jgi:membrane protein YqaA with SNARE-associated domain
VRTTPCGVLFVSAFVSSTLLPGSSEGVLVAAALSGFAPWNLLWVATLGNTLGGLTNWWIGWWIATRYPARRLVSPEQEKALARVRRFGWPVLLLSWLPVIGDPLCLAAGWLRINFWLSAAGHRHRQGRPLRGHPLARAGARYLAVISQYVVHPG